MWTYYLDLAVRSLRRNVVLTGLMVAAVGVGIGTSVTMLTTFVAMSSDPIPDKSSQLYRPQLDYQGDASRDRNVRYLPFYLTYRDATALMQAHRAAHQTAEFSLSLNVKPTRADPFQAAGRAATSDFFSMFEAPFQAGSAWGREEDQNRENVVVLSARLAERAFAGAGAIGKTLNLGKHDFRVVGVLKPWIVAPRFYDLGNGAFGDTEDFYLPFSTAIDNRFETDEYGCDPTGMADAWTQRLNAECGWVEFWVDLPNASQVRDFRSFLVGYARQQQQLGRFGWIPRTALSDVKEWMASRGVVPNEVRINSVIAGGFLLVCLINAVGLMLAKFSSRAAELSIRRAMGASRIDLFLQCITESSIIGVLGALLGLMLTAVGLAALRSLRGVTSQDSVAMHLISLNMTMIVITLSVALIASICSGLYPAFRASRVQPGWQLKAQ